MLPGPAQPSKAPDDDDPVASPVEDAIHSDDGSGAPQAADEGPSEPSPPAAASSSDDESVDQPLERAWQERQPRQEDDEDANSEAEYASSSDWSARSSVTEASSGSASGSGSDDDSLDELIASLAERYELGGDGSDATTVLEQQQRYRGRLLLNAQVATMAREARRDTDVPPIKPPSDAFREPTGLVERFNDRVANMAERPAALQSATGLVDAAPNKPFSTAALSKLVRVNLKALVLRQQAIGTFLLLRVVTGLSRTTSVQFIGQDPEGTALTVVADNQPWAIGASADELCAILPKGSLVVVKEPVLRDDAQGNITLRIHSPTDLVLVTEGVDDVADSVEWRNSVLDPAERPPRRTPKAWKAIGVGYSAKGWLAAAERAFTLGLQLDPDHASLRLARSQVRCQMGRARSALDDAETLLARDHSTYSAALLEKALLAAAGAAYGLQLWAVAQDKLEQMLTLGTDSDDAQHVLDEVNARMHEAATGEYDWEALYLASQEEDGEVDVADYTSDALEIKDVGDDRGRGVVVNRDVPAGTLLMVAKPFAAAVVTPGSGESLALTVNLHCREVEGPSADAGLVSDIVARIVDDPAAADVFNVLCADGQYPVSPHVSVADLAPKIVDQADARALPARPIAVDPSRVELVRLMCSFRVQSLCDADDFDAPGLRVDGSPPVDRSALYALPSFLNHACSPSAFRTFIGDALVIRAALDINAGQEVSISYFAGIWLDYDVRTKLLGQRGVDDCACQLCIEDRKDSPRMRAERTELGQWSPPLPWDLPTRNVAAFEEAFDARFDFVHNYLMSTYNPAHDAAYRLAMWWPCEQMASIAIALALSHPDAAARAKWAASAAEMAREALVSIGAEHAADGDAVDIDPPHDHVDSAVGACLLVAGALKVLGDEAGKRGWVGAALELDRRAVGGGLALLLHRFRFRFGLYGLDPADFQ